MPHHNLTESAIEDLAIKLFKSLGYHHLYGPDSAPEGKHPERSSFEDVILVNRLRDAVKKINPHIPQQSLDDAIRQVLRFPSQELIANNQSFHRLLTEGVKISYHKDGSERGDLVWLIDFKHPENNEFVVVNQFAVIENHQNKRPDVVLFVNGLPLVVIELKNAADENATIQSAYNQIQTYKQAIPGFFTYNEIIVISDGLEARSGSLSAGLDRFVAWKSVDGRIEASSLESQLTTLIKGMLTPLTLIDIIRHFIVYEASKHEDPETGLTVIRTVKKIAAYHQYYAVNRAVASTIRAAGYEQAAQLPVAAPWPASLKEDPEAYGLPSVREQPVHDKKAGVIWHTQGSGKSLSMVFYTGKVVLTLDNPTVVVITDRNDLDDQLFTTFAASKQLLRQEPVQAESRDHLKQLLRVASGGIVFTTIQKFQPDEGNVYDVLSNRNNIIVIVDEAHRTQYGFQAKVDANTGAITYGFAKYLRDALPNATYIGFTGTPIEKTDRNTPAVFGNYIDIYDIAQAVADGTTVRIFYESRLAKIALSDEGKKLVQELDEELLQDEMPEAQKAKAKWTQLEALVGSQERLKQIANDIVTHFEARQEVFEGKGLIVTMSRRIAAALYDEIIHIRPAWHSDDLKKGAIKVVMTSASSDGPEIAKHYTSKEDRRLLAERMKDPQDELKLVIVRDMWLTGFDVPCLHTMYIDKPMKGHTLMQAIARVNRVYKDKPGGLIVDYLGIAADLKEALSFYADNGGKGDPALLQEEAVRLMLEKYEIVTDLLHGFAYKHYCTADTAAKLSIILEAEEFILGLENGRKRYIDEVTALSKAFAIAIPDEQALAIKDEVAFFQAVKSRLVKFAGTSGGKTNEEIETAIRQVIDKALVTGEVIDVFDAAGIKKPDISILSEEFLLEVKNMKHKNIAMEVLKKILNDEIKARTRTNLVQSKSLLELLENAIKRYQNQVLTAAQLIEELIDLAKDIKKMDEEPEAMGLSEFEYAFYSAVANNESARELMGKDKLRELAVALYEQVRQNASIDWTIKESVRSKLKVAVKRTLKRYGYPLDMEALATETVLKQAELIADELCA
ncbi:type I restriction endonuclease subunit R [Gracilinema caldarium]|uniref:Type I restriction enzyme endonuclease subunit n=1 Tax=Gracilinema caldarium (strain ATCC 51460 / DSM 7334 / H1) TaxID=744872 RepID=F8EZR8_GRAC1|nr:type I restriction endonuclease subunit R [Gracilinema caldarium]AEJ20792.1 type I site-specific deoxyribonuclease, HsdR family [Gracilinema caldarium DSM 7334]